MQAQRVLNLNPYKPGEQPTDRTYIKLNANENPYPPPPAVVEALVNKLSASPLTLARYPDPDASALRNAIAAFLNETGGVLCRATAACGADSACEADCACELNSARESCSACEADYARAAPCVPSARDAIPFTVTPDMIFTGNGSDEVLSFVFYSFFDSDRPLIQPEHTYSFYPVYAGYYGIPLVKVPLAPDYSLDTDAMLAAAAEHDASLIFANPNAPTGIGMSRDEVRAFLNAAPKDRVHVVDEAYVDFGGESCIPLLAEFGNLVIVRTFSKSLSFAGMRLGYIVANPDLIRIVTRVKDSFNHFPVDTLALTAGIAACASAAYYADCARKIADERDAFASFLRENGWFVLPSQTNFVLARKDSVSGKRAYEQIKRNGILVRRFDTPGVESFLRITIGTPAQMRALRTAIGDLQ
ncbi:histidinol-phosphate transaminase [Treponema brennaborense]|uniref:Histidinol-phosphate aminotransferase n=1 Tax=Treponema brennaborense (strain DSM 12168 / CIP 105900 / DD5/3) TaxID=906968 RepID=F4LQ89_TREBD|nr:histidinol-phosphate transaminase [Treponema brennaborense]AEE16110.1 Histidinol-phosphate aminotransferase [Treponema brennaborense DSM 12168]